MLTCKAKSQIIQLHTMQEPPQSISNADLEKLKAGFELQYRSNYQDPGRATYYVPPRLGIFVIMYYGSGQSSFSFSGYTNYMCFGIQPLLCISNAVSTRPQETIPASIVPPSAQPHLQEHPSPYHDLEPEPLRNECYLLDVECRTGKSRG